MANECDPAVLRKRRSIVKASCTRIKSYVDSVATISPPPIAQLEERKNKLESYWSEYNILQTQLEIHCDTESNDRILFEESFYGLSAKIRDMLRPRSVMANTASSSAIPDSSEPLVHVRLPKLDLPTFSDKYEEWFPFRDTFLTVIHANPTINNIQRLQYLKASLIGDAKEIISALEITDTNYSVAWDLLKGRYDNQRIIVENHIKALFELPNLSKENPDELRQIAVGATRHIQALSALKRPTDGWDDLLIYILSSKLDAVTLREWRSSITGSELPTLRQFLDFISHQCGVLESMNKPANTQPKSHGMQFKPGAKKQASCLASFKIKCILCQADHSIYQCKSFLDLTIPRRIEEARARKLCLNCLRSTTHTAKKCPSGNCKTCALKHNTLLHLIRTPPTPRKSDVGVGPATECAPDIVAADASGAMVSCASSILNNNVLLSTAIVLANCKDGTFKSCRVLLDSGSQANFISRECLNSLGLIPHSVDIAISGISGTSSRATQSVELSLHSRLNSFSKAVECIVTDHITDMLPALSMNRNTFKLPRNIQLADPKFHVSSKIDILIGAELFWELLCVGQIRSSNDHPTLQKTRFGWVLAGRLVECQPQSRAIQTLHASVSNADLREQLSRFWLIDDINHKSYSYTCEENICERHFLETVSREPTGRYIVQLPLRENAIHKLGESRDIALKRLHSLEKRLKQDPNLKKQYASFMDEYLKLGHMKPVVEASFIEPGTYYLPHHCVNKYTINGSKFRVVFNGSCKTSSGISLNDTMRVGPVVQEDLFSILLRFRSFKYALVADIKKMYRQIRLHKSQTCLQRILWRNDAHSDIQTYELLTVTYGTSSASFLATRCLRHLAEQYADKFPLGSQCLKRDFYVDDMITGSDSISQLKLIREDIIQLLRLGSFELGKWGSNCSEVLDGVDDRSGMLVSLDGEDDFRILGVLWDRDNDMFRYSYKHLQYSHEITKRTILSELSRLFDPLGLLGPIIVVAKVILQQLWKAGVDWDESIPQDLHSRWLRFKQQLAVLNNLEIPRCIKVHSNSQVVQVHGFCDASQHAFGACIYVRSVSEWGVFTSRLLCSRSRVAPVKTISLPRLELSAALLLARLVDKVRASFNISDMQIILWSDSTITLNWITATSRKWSVFVANRVGEIQCLTDEIRWRHVISSDNPADILSRGSLPGELMSADIWWHGPAFLRLPDHEWPGEEFVRVSGDLPEQVAIRATVASINPSIVNELLNKFSNLNKICRIIAYILRFIRPKSRPQNIQVTPQEITNALNVMCKTVQRERFSHEYSSLGTNRETNRSSNLRSLSPFMGEDGLIRVGGRLKNSALSFDACHQIILPRNHTLTRRIVELEHQRNMHSGLQSTMASVRQRFWPLNLRSATRKVIGNCMRCFRAKPTFSEALMGALPATRVTISRPFSHCGVDYAGPLTLREGKRRNSRNHKAYVSVFVCFATKAIHLEVVSDLTSDAFIAALKRFIARRGKPVRIYSDNATTFVGAQRQIKEFYDFIKTTEAQDSINNFLLEHQTTWNFIPPHTPHFGGLWEAAVKSAKFHLTRVAAGIHLTFEELQTVLCEIEAILNSRPLIPLSSDANDLSYLSPGHFLIGSPLNSFPQPDLTDENMNRLVRWKIIEQTRQHFWRRWSCEYLNQLQERHKWKNSKGPQLTPGQLVTIKQAGLPPLQWLVGRVENTHPGPDGIARSATIKTAKGSYVRPLSKLAILPT